MSKHLYSLTIMLTRKTHIAFTFLRCRGGLVVTDRVVRIYSVGEGNILADGWYCVTNSCRWRNAIPTPPGGEISKTKCLNSILVYDRIQLEGCGLCVN
jgi:hypothetical protein